MRIGSAPTLAAIILLSSMLTLSVPEYEEGLDHPLLNNPLLTGPKAANCQAVDVSTLQPLVNLADQTCLQVSLGSLSAASLVSIDADVTGGDADLLLFAANSVGVYLNDQSYRSDQVWEGDASVESLTGPAEWHWQVPEGSETVWYLILDNMAHLGDGGQGGQGGAQANISLSVTFPVASHWTLMDSLQVLAPGTHTALLTPDDLTLDEGTQVSLTALPLSGVGDLFILTESQKDTYLMGGGGTFWVPGTEILAISTATTKPWVVPADLAGEPLYLFLDNEAGPVGGGDGSTELKITVSVTLLPILEGVISSTDDLQDLDVDETVSFDVNATPNLSLQADLTATEWDFNGDGVTDATGAYVETTFASPGNRSVKATVHGPDGRSASSTIPVVVIDSTAPVASILGSDTWVRDVDAEFTLTSTSQDNWQIVREEWRVDGSLVTSFSTGQSSFTHSLNTTGNHTVELTVVDGANNVDATTVLVQVRDGTKPVVGVITGESSVMQGVAVTFSVVADDPESEHLAYEWDFDKEVDSDADDVTGNDVQATGPTVQWTFTEAKPTYVTVTVTNDEGLSRVVQHLIEVEVDPSLSASSDSVMNSTTPLIALVVIILVGAVGWFTWNRRKQNIQAEALALARAEAEAEAAQEPEEPDREGQLSMFSRKDAGYTGYGATSSGGDAALASLAGDGYGRGAVSSTALAVFGEEDDGMEEKDDILGDLDFLRKTQSKTSSESQPEPEPEPETASTREVVDVTKGKVAKRSAGVALPDSAGGSAQATRREHRRTASTRSRVPATSEADAPTGGITTSAVQDAEPTPTPSPAVTTVKAACPACAQMFAVDMPDDIPDALVACPKCEQRIRLER